MTTTSPRFPRHTFNPAIDLLEAEDRSKGFVERGRALTQLLLALLDSTPLFSYEVDAVVGTGQGHTDARTKAHTSTRPQQEIEFRTRLAYLIEAYRDTLPVPGALKMEQAEWCDRVFKTLAYFMELDGVERNVKMMIRGVRTFVDPWPIKDMKADDPGYYAQVWRGLFPPLDRAAHPRCFEILREMDALFAIIENPWQRREEVKELLPNSAEELEQQLVTAFLARSRNWEPMVRVPYGPVLNPIIDRFINGLTVAQANVLHVLVTNRREDWLTAFELRRGVEHLTDFADAAYEHRRLSCMLGDTFLEMHPHLEQLVRNPGLDDERYYGLVMSTDPAVLLELIAEPVPIG